MQYDHLPIYKSALDFCVYIEMIVKNFDRYSRYSIGEDLRKQSKELLFLIHRANMAEDKRELLHTLAEKCEEIKMMIHVAKERSTTTNRKKHVTYKTTKYKKGKWVLNR